jgi:hypothetical protein
MIVVDSSCLLAIRQDEPEKDAFTAVLEGGDRCILSAVNAHEAACVMRGRYGAQGVEGLWDLIAAAETEIVPFDEQQMRAAATAFDWNFLFEFSEFLLLWAYVRSRHDRGLAKEAISEWPRSATMATNVAFADLRAEWWNLEMFGATRQF